MPCLCEWSCDIADKHSFFISDSPWSYLGYCIATDALGESYQLKPVRSNPALAMKAHPDIARPVSSMFYWVVDV